jgi:nucleoside-diphosphate-sugar epimerase
MRVFLAGAAGAIGRQLVPMLVSAGHHVIGTTRDAARADWLRSAGAEPVLLDALDSQAVRNALAAAQPQAVIHQLTDLAAGFAPEQLRATARLREVGTRNLVEAMPSAGVHRLVAQSGAWLYADGPLPHSERDPLRDGGPDDPVMRGIAELERLTLATPSIDGLVMRYGFLYGPGTAYAERDGTQAPRVHVAAAARAAMLALERGSPGAYNVVDDDPAVTNRRARAELSWTPELRQGANSPLTGRSHARIVSNSAPS